MPESITMERGVVIHGLIVDGERAVYSPPW